MRVERSSNTRTIHGVKKTVANVVCQHCGNEWWSYHSIAIKAMRAADKMSAAAGYVDGTQITVKGQHIQ